VKESIAAFFPTGVAGAAALAKKLYVADRLKEAAEVTKVAAELLKISGTVEQKQPVFARIDGVMKGQGHPADWGTKTPPKFEGRPDVTKMGPLLWAPSDAPKEIADYQKKGRPVVLVFHLGPACESCTKQLEALKKFEPQFTKAGIDVAAIGTEAVKGEYPFSMHVDAKQAVFKAFGVYDDFENFPLHGTILVDSAGKIRWKDVGAAPYGHLAFLLREAQWLLRPD